MLLARNAKVHRLLSKQFELREVEKEYITLLEGKVAEEEGIIELAFRLDPENRPYQIYDLVRGKKV